MSHFWHGFLHVVLTAGQVINVASPFVPPPYNILVAGGLAAVQGAVAVYQKFKAAKAPATTK